MKVTHLPISGLILLELPVYQDNRGFFIERFHQNKFADAGLPTNFLQDNFSHSIPGVIRGLHAQYSPGQGKLVGVTSGEILDVAVDIRYDSPTFGQHYSVKLSAENGKCLWIPAGFAHGFAVLGNQPADVLYKVDALYNQGLEVGIRFDDPELNIEWPISTPVVHGRDLKLPSFATYKQSPRINW